MSLNTGGQVLGATTTVGVSATGIALLPSTGDSPLSRLLIYTAIIAGTAILLSFVISRLYKKLPR